jgi:uncharacterized protein (DUF433 family)
MFYTKSSRRARFSGSRTSGNGRRKTSAPKRLTSPHDLRRARRLAVRDPKILGGDPVFRDTRIPVHLIAELVAQGSKPNELIQGYPRLTAEMFRLAPIYAAAYPLRRRPPKQPWRDQPPVRSRRCRLDAITDSSGFIFTT